MCDQTGHLAKDCLVTRCYKCGKFGHLARNSLERPKVIAAIIRKQDKKVRELQDKLKELYDQCNTAESKVNEYLKAKETEVKAVACQPVANKPSDKPRGLLWTYRQHDKVDCAQGFSAPVVVSAFG